MSYADGRRLFDADSHVMEMPGFLTAFADPGARHLMPDLGAGPLTPAASTGGEGGRAEASRYPGHPPERVEAMVALGDGLLTGPKFYEALGAFNPEERRVALDLLGFERQVVFPTFSAAASFFARDEDARYAIARATTRAMVDFCGHDDRLLPVGVVPLHDPDRARAEAELAVAEGAAVAWVPHTAAGDRSPGHLDLDPVWAVLAEAGVPFALHVGGAPIQVPPAWMANGRPLPTDWLGGAENVRGKDMVALHHDVETWLGCLVLDGVFERHPALRGMVTELGAAYVPSMLHRLDYCVHAWKRSEPELAALTATPSEAIAEHVRFTPYPHEDVGELIALSDPGLYLFSSDYPHREGGRTPLERFDSWLAGTSPADCERFFHRNAEELFART
jgi:predicted TIM-barrel fold metal-dependent hydrolase